MENRWLLLNLRVGTNRYLLLPRRIAVQARLTSVGWRARSAQFSLKGDIVCAGRVAAHADRKFDAWLMSPKGLP